MLSGEESAGVIRCRLELSDLSESPGYSSVSFLPSDTVGKLISDKKVIKPPENVGEEICGMPKDRGPCDRKSEKLIE